MRAPSPTLSRAPFCSAAAIRRRHACVDERHFDIFQRGRPRQQRRRLEHETDRSATRRGAVCVSEPRNVDAVQFIVPGIGLSEQPEKMQEGRFSRARTAANGDEFARCDGDRHIDDRSNGRRARAIDLVEIRRADERVCHSVDPRHADKKPAPDFRFGDADDQELAFAQPAGGQFGAVFVGGSRLDRDRRRAAFDAFDPDRRLVWLAPARRRV